MPVYAHQRIKTGSPQADHHLRKLVRAVQTAMPVGMGISRTPSGTLHNTPQRRARMPVARSNQFSWDGFYNIQGQKGYYSGPTDIWCIITLGKPPQIIFQANQPPVTDDPGTVSLRLKDIQQMGAIYVYGTP